MVRQSQSWSQSRSQSWSWSVSSVIQDIIAWTWCCGIRGWCQVGSIRKVTGREVHKEESKVRVVERNGQVRRGNPRLRHCRHLCRRRCPHETQTRLQNRDYYHVTMMRQNHEIHLRLEYFVDVSKQYVEYCFLTASRATSTFTHSSSSPPACRRSHTSSTSSSSPGE